VARGHAPPVSDQSPPYPGSFWVIPGMLLAGGHPGGQDPSAMDSRLTAVLDAGIRSVINLMDEEEGAAVGDEAHYAHYEDRLDTLGEERGEVIEIERYAIDDGSMPGDGELQMILDAIDAEIDGRGSPTLVHCATGLGRTAVIAGCYLARHGMATGKEAIDKIHELRQDGNDTGSARSPENIVQERLIQRWKEDQ